MPKTAARTLLTPVAFESSHPDALAVFCSDGRYSHAVEVLARSLGHARVDTLTLPGGPGLLHPWTSPWSEREAVTRGVRFLVEGHRLERVILVAHEGCGFYRALLPHLSVEDRRKRQLEDVQSAVALLRKAHPDLAVAAFFARPEAGKVAFEPIN